MGLGPRLDLRQSQSLVMTPQLQQAIKLLALTNIEVEAFIAEEIEKNPLLETGSEDDRVSPADAREDAPEFAPPDNAGDAFDDADPATADRLIAVGDGAGDQPLDVDYGAETFHHDSAADMPAEREGPGADGGLSLSGGGAAGGGDGEGEDFGFLTAEPTLHEHLTAQAGLRFSGGELILAQHLIDQIGEAGYFTGDLLDLSHRLGAPMATLEAVLAGIQGFDPAGVGARDLAECLAIQAREADRYDPAMARLIDNLDLLARSDVAALRRICGVDQEDLVDMIRELRGYDPKPGLRFGTDAVQPAIPDVFVTRTRDGWAVELNSASLPRVLVNRSYYVELTRTGISREHRAFLSDCLASANWLVKALDQRARTITKVATELVRQQEAFFSHGVSHLKPLTLKAIADAVSLHESTISRVTSNKYLSCSRGTFELKYFFTSAIQAADGGDAVSALAVKEAIRALIAAESADTILSDDKLVELLRDKGFDIARRTVAKYREAMGIGSSVQRRRAKLLEAA